MGFTDNSIEFNGKTYHEFRRIKEVRYTDFELSDSIILDTCDSKSRFIRQENGKTYVLTHGSNPISNPEEKDISELSEYLIYDFTANENDILHLRVIPSQPETDSFTVSETGSIVIAGRNCKVMKLKELSYMTDYEEFNLIESIGTTFLGSLANYALTQLNGSSSSPDESRALYTILMSVYDETGQYIYRHPKYNKYDPRASVTEITDQTQLKYIFNLQGQQVTAPVKGELYILRDNRGTRKVVF